MSIASEKMQRRLAQTITGDDLVAKKGAFSVSTDKGEEIQEVPFVYYSNFIAKVVDIVNQHER